MMTLSQAAALVGGVLHGDDATFTRVVTDTRSPGESAGLFCALVGPRFDGHDFLSAARDSGVAGALVSRLADLDLPQILVGDTTRALAALAAGWRAQLTQLSLWAVTGSNGKTTVKEMLAAVARRTLSAGGVDSGTAGGGVHQTPGNYNNHIGVPLTLLGLRPHHRYAVVELGTSAPGEIAPLAALCSPRVAVINNVAPAHLGGFGSLEAIAREKGSIARGLVAGGVLVINSDDPFSEQWRCEAPGAVVGFGFDAGADLRGHWSAQQGQLTVTIANAGAFPRASVDQLATTGLTLRMPLPGRHNAANALAALAVAGVEGLPLESAAQAIEAMQPIPGRLRELSGRNGARVFDDTYNANPGSVEAALDVLAAQPGRRILVLGPLAELGAGAADAYAMIGRRAGQLGIDRVIGVAEAGAAAERFAGAGSRVADLDAAAAALADELHDGTVILVKGSRSAGMEKLLPELTATAIAHGRG